ncbi:MAG: DUF4282 domain-containing protein [Sulfuricaulis sp.]
MGFFTFDKMITPVFIHVIYWIGIAVVVLAGFSTIHEGSPVRGVLGIVAGLIMTRVSCEVLIVLFRINDNLSAIRENKGR